MIIEITDDLKEKFEEFCKKTFPEKKYVSNKGNNEKYFFIQIGNYFSDKIHCEYRYDYETNTNNIELHIEFDNKKTSNAFYLFLCKKIFKKLDSNKTNDIDHYKWISLIYANKIKDENDLFRKIRKIVNKLDKKL